MEYKGLLYRNGYKIEKEGDNQRNMADTHKCQQGNSSTRIGFRFRKSVLLGSKK